MSCSVTKKEDKDIDGVLSKIVQEDSHTFQQHLIFCDFGVSGLCVI